MIDVVEKYINIYSEYNTYREVNNSLTQRNTIQDIAPLSPARSCIGRAECSYYSQVATHTHIAISSSDQTSVCTTSATATTGVWTLSSMGAAAPLLLYVCVQRRLQHINCTIAHAHRHLVWLPGVRSNNHWIYSFTAAGQLICATDKRRWLQG